MARTWTALYASVCTSKKLRRLKSDTNRLFYLLLLTQADAWGRIEDDAETLNLSVWPGLDKSEKATEAAIEDLSAQGLALRCQSQSLRWLQVVSWEEHSGKHRGGNPGGSRFPESPRISPDLPETSGELGEIRASTLLYSESHSGDGKSAEKGRGEEGPKLPFTSDSFKALWASWRSHRAAVKAKLSPDTEASQLKKLAKEGEAQATLRITRSIENGWKGLWFPDDPPTGLTASGGKPGPTPYPSREERERRAEEEIKRARELARQEQRA